MSFKRCECGQPIRNATRHEASSYHREGMAMLNEGWVPLRGSNAHVSDDWTLLGVVPRVYMGQRYIPLWFLAAQSGSSEALVGAAVQHPEVVSALPLVPLYQLGASVTDLLQILREALANLPVRRASKYFTEPPSYTNPGESDAEE